jgi:hypothetical protein
MLGNIWHTNCSNVGNQQYVAVSSEDKYNALAVNDFLQRMYLVYNSY